MDFFHIRHATSFVSFGGLKLLIDPVFSPKGHRDPIPMTPHPVRNPTVELPLGSEELAQQLLSLDLLLVTHRHEDHYDKVAKEILPRHIPVICQPQDEAAFINDGFTSIHPVMDSMTFKGVQISRTSGQHGLEREDLGPVSGFVLENPREPVVYFAGDTVWCPEVEKALADHQPDIVVVNAGGARFLVGKQITMTDEDIGFIMEKSPPVRVIAVHMEAINHCIQSRQELRHWARKKGISHKLLIPEDGENVLDLH